MPPRAHSHPCLSLPLSNIYMHRFLAFTRATDSSPQSNVDQNLEEVMAALYSIQLYLTRLLAMSDAFHREQLAFDQEQIALESAIKQAADRIEQKKKELEQSRVNLSHAKEYEELKKKIVSVPARSMTKLEIEAVQAETEDLKQQGQELDVVINRRKRQLAAVAAMIDELCAGIQQQEQGEGGGGGGGRVGGASPPPLNGPPSHIDGDEEEEEEGVIREGGEKMGSGGGGAAPMNVD